MSDLINAGISNIYTSGDYSKATEALRDKLSNTDYSQASDEELMEACKSFEAYFIEQVMKGMEKTIPKSDEDDDSGSSYLEMFKDNLYQEYADMAADQSGGIGIARMLYEQMKRNYNL